MTILRKNISLKTLDLTQCTLTGESQSWVDTGPSNITETDIDTAFQAAIDARNGTLSIVTTPQNSPTYRF